MLDIASALLSPPPAINLFETYFHFLFSLLAFDLFYMLSQNITASRSFKIQNMFADASSHISPSKCHVHSLSIKSLIMLFAEYSSSFFSTTPDTLLPNSV
jgi:hypothetical protein